jgi:hypothetical protein
MDEGPMLYFTILMFCLLGQALLCFAPPFPVCHCRSWRDLVDLERIRRLLRR